MDECQMEALHRAVAKRRVSHHTSSEKMHNNNKHLPAHDFIENNDGFKRILIVLQIVGGRRKRKVKTS